MSAAYLRVPAKLKCQLPCEDLAGFISSFMMYNCLAENKTNLSQRSCQTIIETLSPGWSQTWSMAKLLTFRKLANFSSQILSHTWGSQVQVVHLSSKKYNKLIAP